ncbi:MAG: TetR family transcriptional regulator [Microbacteriaceae bacterium]|nr:TetR family transcriptional regulator [Microbacteriaceae bacterium]
MSSYSSGESATSVATAVLRNEPVQARSTARLTSLLDAAAAVVDGIGFERLTTAMIADRAGSSIGTVYRYFPDRIAVLHALSGRSMTRFAAEGIPAIESPDRANWLEAVEAALQYWVGAFRSEPGFRALRFGDVLDLQPRAGDRTNNGVIAAALVSVLSSRHGLEANDELQFRVEVALELCDSLLARAFAFDRNGDARFTDEALTVARGYLIGAYGNPASDA